MAFGNSPGYEDKPIVAERWVSEGNVPHWIDHIMPGNYILQETRVPTKAGYVTAEDVEVTILEPVKYRAM